MRLFILDSYFALFSSSCLLVLGWVDFSLWLLGFWVVVDNWVGWSEGWRLFILSHFGQRSLNGEASNCSVIQGIYSGIMSILEDSTNFLSMGFLINLWFGIGLAIRWHSFGRFIFRLLIFHNTSVVSGACGRTFSFSLLIVSRNLNQIISFSLDFVFRWILLFSSIFF